ncbi:hypothetical protein [Legionella jordanis]|uniref:Transmembrane protein n=1 Tax=Legionella jordanis TaxID=456 RepID=A0A0W0VC37_9GAMM|nr:hypothetical protein [Legionella jordanis]KTD17681.1 hypothetical protein Ljor_1987 [Legionella jordanis]RMX01553.1 hypothetical protein EAW55_10665 [Legionella jordanis]RMX21549.1 hypothetical protein EAS68_01950 [Legionella jordanis]VEH11390.1 Uncharacterised protein [Legionella jordanis]HAT8715058.1 hypothetical protein [Legionella jordanis]
MTKFVYLLGLLIAWILFYNILTRRRVRFPKLKTTIIVLLFSGLIVAFSNNLYAFFDRLLFSLNKAGEVALVNSPFKIPANQDANYCKQFKDQDGHEITVVSVRSDGRYCGDFWRFKERVDIFLPYKHFNNQQWIYWASPNLQIIANK